MYTLVILQGRRQTETLVTEFTVKRFFSGVDAMVSHQVSRLTEALTTKFTVERFVSSVDRLVYLEIM